jgi:hypothetical protein
MPVRNREKPTHTNDKIRKRTLEALFEIDFLFIQQCRSGGEEE